MGIAALPLLAGLHKLWGLISVAVLTFVAVVARRAGDEAQTHLWTAWGGAPTAQLLQFARGDETVVGRRHAAVEAFLGGGLKLPTKEAEAADEVAANAQYQDATRRVIALVRDKPQHKLMAKENRHYGFSRNLYGLKRYGVGCAAAILAASAVAALFVGVFEDWPTARALILPAVVAAIAPVAWRFVTPAFVKPNADAYADRLFETLETTRPPG